MASAIFIMEYGYPVILRVSRLQIFCILLTRSLHANTLLGSEVHNFVLARVLTIN
jgi:hypothetical protein